MKTIRYILPLMCLSLCAQAQMLIVPKEKLESVANPRLSEYASSLKFKTMAITADKMSEDDGIETFVYPFENTGSDTLKIRRLVSTCSCASVSCENMTVPPEGASKIVVRYNPKGHPGRFERRFFVYVEDDSAPAAVLRLSVNVERGSDISGLYPVSMGNIRLRRSEVVLHKGTRAVERCVFVNVGDRPLRLQCENAMLPACLSFRTEPDVVVSGEEGEIVITYDPSEGGERKRIPVIIKGLGLPPSQSSITVTFKEE